MLLSTYLILITNGYLLVTCKLPREVGFSAIVLLAALNLLEHNLTYHGIV